MINFALNDHVYCIVYNKIRIFYQENFAIQIPSESCCDKIKRRLFTDEPSPYYFDYGIPNPSNQTINQMIMKLCHIYGLPDGRQTFTQYSMVSHSYTSHSQSFSKTSVISRNKSNCGKPIDRSPSTLSFGCAKYKISPTKHRIFPAVEESDDDHQQSNSKLV